MLEPQKTHTRRRDIHRSYRAAPGKGLDEQLLSNAPTDRQPAGHLGRHGAVERVVAQRVEKGDERGRVGGNVQSAKLVRQPKPVYPPLARQARIQGQVKFTAVIGNDGTIQNLQLISGHPLLVQSAQDAVRQWVYQPTLLNGEPVQVITQIDVNFTLTQ